ncbi:MAG: thrombospondin type 3 repeat-containing protein [Patescibacteria group bacterium]|nr:thrombospondin type 3 repeat-containing protein [Patescibacteria group bacterium]
MAMFNQPNQQGNSGQAPAPTRIAPPPIRPPMPSREPEDIFANIPSRQTGSTGASQTPTPPRRGGRRIALVFIIFIIIILLVVGGALAYLSFVRQPAAPVVNLPNINVPLVNQNANVNQNVNLNAPINSNVNTNVNQPVAPSLGYAIGIDSDNDGLTNIEETLYGTEPNNPDTDKDGFSDGSELINLYDPTKGAGALLANSTLIKIYTNSKFTHSIFYPAKWSAEANSDGTQTVFQSSDEENIKVSVQNNPAKVTLYEFVLSKNPTADLTQYTKTTTKGGYDDLVSPDKLTHFVTRESQIDKVYVITYTLGAEEVAYYLSTLQMMVNSFKLTK